MPGITASGTIQAQGTARLCTKWFSGLHLVVLFPFWLFCVHCLFFWDFYSFKKRPQKTGHCKTPKKQKYRKKEQTKDSVSAVVFTNSVPNFLGMGYTHIIFAEAPIKLGFEHTLRKEKQGQKCEKVESKICPRSCRKSVQLCFATSLDRCSTQKVFSFLFLSHSPCIIEEDY